MVGNGMWRSLVAHLTGGQGVAGSNPVIPTVKEQVRGLFRFGGAALELSWLPKWLPKYALDEHGRSQHGGGWRRVPRVDCVAFSRGIPAWLGDVLPQPLPRRGFSGDQCTRPPGPGVARASQASPGEVAPHGGRVH